MNFQLVYSTLGLIESSTFKGMIYLVKRFCIARVFFLLLPTLLTGQLYDSQRLPENGNHYFSLGYFPASWQSNVFFEDAYIPKEIQQKVDFNILSNALRLNYLGAEKMLAKFKQEFPNSIEATTIDFDVATYYFNNEKYRYALKWFSRVSENQVPMASIHEYNFNKGYTLFSAKRFKQAKPYLEKVKHNKVYESDAHYYLGHIAYQLEDFDEAASQFSNISNEAQKENLSYFQSDMNFRLGRFEQAIALGKPIIKNNTTGEVSEISKIIGESYFNLNSFMEAIPYLEAYEGKKGTWENVDFYQLGFAYYKKGDYDKAIGQFNKIIGNKNSLAQNAYYYLADCYLKTSQKASAQNAFKSASQMDFDLVIKEDAFLNYAKLTYEIGNPYEEPPRVLVNFLEQFPKNAQSNLIGQLLIDSYTKNGNYEAALEILEGKNGYKNNATLQRVLVLKAIEDFKSGDYTKSIGYFEKALKINENQLLEAYSIYWLGRSKYELNQFDDALEVFKKFKKHPQQTNIANNNRLSYDMAYIYFKLGEYEFALKSFESFNAVNSSFDTSYQRDTFLRMGDCQFALKQYWSAMENYNTAIAFSPKQAAYALFQKGMSYG
ncbi:MAG: tetratricopeptide (TPR) repeat protein, partial [Flavobacteriaceae bacterium]